MNIEAKKSLTDDLFFNKILSDIRNKNTILYRQVDNLKMFIYKLNGNEDFHISEKPMIEDPSSVKETMSFLQEYDLLSKTNQYLLEQLDIVNNELRKFC